MKKLIHMIGLGWGSYKSPCGENRPDGEVKRTDNPAKVTCPRCLEVLKGQPISGQGRQEMAHSYLEGLEIGKQRGTGQFSATERGSRWSTEPDVGRVAHGVPARVDRLRGLGNAVAPIPAEEAFMRLMGIDLKGVK